MDKQIFGENITIIDDPTIDFAPGSVPFDDEGVPTWKKVIVEKGVLKNFIFDLDSGNRFGKGSSGNGFKKSMFEKGIEVKPNPRFTNLYLEPGDLEFDEMVKSIDEGLVINDVIGFHSGNMLVGEFSMNVGVGAYIKNGNFVGRPIDTMIAGNVYEDFYNIKALGKKVKYNPLAYTPDILFSKMSVSGKG